MGLIPISAEHARKIAASHGKDLDVINNTGGRELLPSGATLIVRCVGQSGQLRCSLLTYPSSDLKEYRRMGCLPKLEQYQCAH